MDKYHIYEEIGKGEFSQIFKGREKKKIEYVAIKRVDKSIMKKIVNEVQIIHKFDSPHVLRFYDWYETRNNLWLIVEYCTGGDLASLLQQDHHLPEESIRIFGLDLLSGLKYLHQLGVLHCDLQPRNILIDEYGILKISDFKYARKIPKSLQNDDGNSTMENDRTLSYLSPELVHHPGLFSFASEFWAMGCMLYQLRRGFLPFGDISSLQVAEERTKTIEPVMHPLFFESSAKSKENIPPFSAELGDLLQWMLEKGPRDRIDWSSLCNHPFWGSNALEPPSLPPQPAFEEFLQITEVGIVGRDEAGEDLPAETPDRLPSDVSEVKKDAAAVSTPTSQIKTSESIRSNFRRVSFSQCTVDLISLLVHPSDAMIRPIVDNKAIEVIDKPAVKSNSLPYHQNSPLLTNDDLSRLTQPQLEGYLTLIYKHLLKTTAPSSSSNLKGSLSNPPSSAQLADRCNILTHLLSLSSSVEVANIVLNTHFLPLLLKILRQSAAGNKVLSNNHPKSGGQLLTASRILCATCLALMLRYATFIQPPPSNLRTKSASKLRSNSNTSEENDSLIGVLVHVIKEAPTLNGRTSAYDIKLRRRVMAGLGELLFYISAQEEADSEGMWNLPSLVIATFTKGLLDETDEVVLHYAAKAIENILAQGTAEFRERLLFPEVASKLGALCVRSNTLALQVTSASALSHFYSFLLKMCRASAEINLGTNKFPPIALLTRVHEKCESAFPTFVVAMQDAESRLQQAYINLFNSVLSTKSNDDDDQNSNSQVDAIFRQTRRFLAKSNQLMPVILRAAELGATDVIKAKALLCVQLVNFNCSPTF